MPQHRRQDHRNADGTLEKTHPFECGTKPITNRPLFGLLSRELRSIALPKRSWLPIDVQRAEHASGQSAIVARLRPKQTRTVHGRRLDDVQAAAATQTTGGAHVALVIGSRSGVFSIRIVVCCGVYAGRQLDGADVLGVDANVAHQLVGGTRSAGPTVSAPDW